MWAPTILGRTVLRPLQSLDEVQAASCVLQRSRRSLAPCAFVASGISASRATGWVPPASRLGSGRVSFACVGASALLSQALAEAFAGTSLLESLDVGSNDLGANCTEAGAVASCSGAVVSRVSHLMRSPSVRSRGLQSQVRSIGVNPSSPLTACGAPVDAVNKLTFIHVVGHWEIDYE